MARLTNIEVEDVALAWVMELERRAGRQPVDTRRRAGAPADIESPPRVIEVKAHGGSGRGEQIWLEQRQFDEAKRNPDFWLYIVDNIRQGDPSRFRVAQIGGDQLSRLLRRAIERRHYEMPVPVAEFDEAVAGAANGTGGSSTPGKH